MRTATLAFQAALLSAAGIVAGPAQATTRHVPSEYPTINSGLEASVSGDTVLVAPGLYTEADTSGLALSCAYLVGGVKLISEGGPQVTTIDMLGAEAFYANPVRAAFSNEPMWIEGFAITGAPQGHAGIAAGSIPKLTVKDCLIRDIDANPTGGGGITAAYIDLDVIGCHFLRCYAIQGAGIGIGPCDLLVADCVFEECEVNAIQMVTNEFNLHDESMVIENSRFVRNHTPDAGGAIVGAIRGDIVIRGCWFEENTAGTSGGGHGGAIWFYGPWGARTVEDCVLWKNEALSITSMAGGIYAAIETEIDNCTFVANSQGSVNALTSTSAATNASAGPR